MTQEVSYKDSLYHFSDLPALQSIIEKRALWLTRCDFLNDTEEIRYIYNIIQISKEDITDAKFKTFIEECLVELNSYFEEKNTDNNISFAIRACISSIYILSTSTKNDNLSLWHYYSGGTGCSMKINIEELQRQFESNNPSIGSKNAQIFMRKINYGYNFPHSKLFDTLKAIYENGTLNSEHKKLVACIHIIYEGIFTKNQNMSQEEEFRVAIIVGNEPEYSSSRLIPKFRVSKNTFIPYLEIKVNPQTLINEICIAPLNKTDIAKKGLYEFLKSNNFKITSELVKISDIKLRY